jgi:UDP-3-O-[3-hydroxymyristoyl] N-acetylglucosamine deacetylase
MHNAQRTLRNAVRFAGVGLHSGLTSTVTILPARACSGVIFVSPKGAVRAHVRNAIGVGLTTSLRSPGSGVTVHTVEHLLAALSAHGVDNACIRIEQDQCEVSVPILDGSALPYSDALVNNVVELPGTRRRRICVRRQVEVTSPAQERSVKFVPAVPSATCLDLRVTIDFGSRIRVGQGGRQHFQFSLHEDSSESFRKEVASARTFCFESDLKGMRDAGLIKGGDLVNACVFGEQSGDCLTPGGLRFDNEPCRHKLLDFIGDLSLAGAPLVGQVEALRPGHEMNQRALMTLLSTPENYEIVA